MLKRLDTSVMSRPICYKPIVEYTVFDFNYYDKDGFELNLAEQKYYTKMNYPLDNCLNHLCFQQNWFISTSPEIIIDHSLILHRCGYEDQAREQLRYISKEIPQAGHLLSSKPKWGFDFALDSKDPSGYLFEVLHIEYDSKSYDNFVEHMISFEYKVRHIDWIDSAKKIIENKDKWQHLKGFEQNNWKSNYLIGWIKAEHTEKSF